jgi:hypothetical protein
LQSKQKVPHAITSEGVEPTKPVAEELGVPENSKAENSQSEDLKASLSAAQAKKKGEKKGANALSQTKQSNSKSEPVVLLPAEQEQSRAIANQVLSAIDRTHGYLSKTILSQFFAGTDNKAIQGLRLSRLNEFGMLKAWKRTHVSSLLDLMLDTTLLLLTELRQGKVTVSLGPIGLACLSGSQAYPDQVIGFIHKSSLSNSEITENQALVPTTAQGSRLNKQEELDSKSAPTDPSCQDLGTSSSSGLQSVANHKQGKQIDAPIPTKPGFDEDQREDFGSKEIASSIPAELPSPQSWKSIPAVQDKDVPQALVEVRSADQLTTPHKSDANAIRDPMSPTVEDWYWSARLAQHGYRLGEIALIRGKQPDQILEDLCKALDRKIKIPIDQLFDRRTQISMRELQSSGTSSGGAPASFSSFPRLWEFAKRWANL